MFSEPNFVLLFTFFLWSRKYHHCQPINYQQCSHRVVLVPFCIICSLHLIAVWFLQTILQALFIPFNHEGMGVGKRLIPSCKNFEGMGRAMGIWKNFARSRAKKGFGCRSASDSMFARILGTFFWVLISRKRGVLRDTVSMYLTILKNMSHWDPAPGKKMPF